jgi:hypothetical protein
MVEVMKLTSASCNSYLDGKRVVAQVAHRQLTIDRLLAVAVIWHYARTSFSVRVLTTTSPRLDNSSLIRSRNSRDGRFTLDG